MISEHDHRTASHSQAIAKACRLIMASPQSPGIHALAAEAGMSPSHFHRVFKTLTGLTPKAYARAHRTQRVRKALSGGRSVTSAIYDAGFNSSGRFYENSNNMLGMKPSSFRAGGQGTTIRFAVGECSLGSILVAASEVGVCAITMGDDPQRLVEEFQDRFPKAQLVGQDRPFERLIAQVVGFVDRPTPEGLQLPLDIRGTAFQQRVWQELRRIPLGQTRSYAQIAKALGQPKSTRAVAQACGANPIAVAIPCHRVVRTDGSLCGYHWGVERKAKLLQAERADYRPAIARASSNTTM